MSRRSEGALRWIARPTSSDKYKTIAEFGEMMMSEMTGRVIVSVIFTDGTNDRLPLDEVFLDSRDDERFGYAKF